MNMENTILKPQLKLLSPLLKDLMVHLYQSENVRLFSAKFVKNLYQKKKNKFLYVVWFFVIVNDILQNVHYISAVHQLIPEIRLQSMAERKADRKDKLSPAVMIIFNRNTEQCMQLSFYKFTPEIFL